MSSRFWPLWDLILFKPSKPISSPTPLCITEAPTCLDHWINPIFAILCSSWDFGSFSVSPSLSHLFKV